ncbi:unnamed protein product [Phytophthora fragariaefolia]|uniref:Unnamed protein product n=1 Tax=Phytophthora fragariaefolia TaxID=1490495 RepID=A0A9W6TZC9_9STRA|nr:unnamed protein product [Phytophthora fragariaefolia]
MAQVDTTFVIGLGLASALDTLCLQAYGVNQSLKIGVYFQTGILILSGVLLLRWQDEEVSQLSGQFSKWVAVLVLVRACSEGATNSKHYNTTVIIATISNAIKIGSSYAMAYCTHVGFIGIPIGRSLGYMALPLMLALYFVWQPHHLSQWWGHPWDFKAAARYAGSS